MHEPSTISLVIANCPEEELSTVLPDTLAHNKTRHPDGWRVEDYMPGFWRHASANEATRRS